MKRLTKKTAARVGAGVSHQRSERQIKRPAAAGKSLSEQASARLQNHLVAKGFQTPRPEVWRRTAHICAMQHSQDSTRQQKKTPNEGANDASKLVAQVNM
eukprot:5737145-Pleurochrysis_carterae.AAC.1